MQQRDYQGIMKTKTNVTDHVPYNYIHGKLSRKQKHRARMQTRVCRGPVGMEGG